MAIFFGYALAIVLWLPCEEPDLLAEWLSYPMRRVQPLWDKVIGVALIVLISAWFIKRSMVYWVMSLSRSVLLPVL
jgi:hypothetical protein